VIFLTVGTQLPFDRLVRAVDQFAAARPGLEIFGQIAEPGADGHRPQHFPSVATLDPKAFQQRCRDARVIVAHAGMGSLITALSLGKPILVMPRRGDLGEHRNDHQVATAQHLGTRPGVRVARDAAELAATLDAMLADATAPDTTLTPFAEPRLIAAVRAAILG
jgi:UDP-N-acetylglucosamine transferase subunit ALG13